MCVCRANAHVINNACVICPAGTAYDGKTCNPSTPSNNCGSNQVLINGKCVCQDGFVDVLGKCLVCPTGTSWNGNYCYNPTASSWCMGQPFTHSTNGSCPCQNSYVKLDGCCILKA